MFDVLNLLDSTIKEASKASGRCCVKHATAQGTDSVTYVSISRSLDNDLIPKTALVLDQDEHGKTTTISLEYLDANNFLELNVFFDNDSCFKGIIIYAGNGEPVHELASKIANSFIASGKTAIFPLLERADIQAANKSKVTHTTVLSADGKIKTQMSIAKGRTANDKRKMTVILIQDKRLTSTVFSVEFIEESDIVCNLFLSGGKSYKDIKIQASTPDSSRTLAWKLINNFIEHGEAAFTKIATKSAKKKEKAVTEPAVELCVYQYNDFSTSLAFKVNSKSNEKLQTELCAKLSNPKEREAAMQDLLRAIESKYIQKNSSSLTTTSSSNKRSRYLFPEMRIEIPPSYEQAAFFTLYRSDNFKLRFRLSGRKSINARAKQLLDIIDAFRISPEKLASYHESLLVDEEVASVSKENILRIANLYHCHRKIASDSARITLQNSYNALDIICTRFKKNGSALNLKLSFHNDLLRVIVTEKRYFFSHSKKYTLQCDFLDKQENINTLLVAFYNDKNGSIDQCGLKNSLLAYFLQSRSQRPESTLDPNSSLMLAS